MADLMDGLILGGGVPKEDFVFYGDIGVEMSKLTEAHALYANRLTFKEGDIVRWKLGMRNRSLPYGRPMIVMGPVPDGTKNPLDDPFTAYFNETLDIIIGTFAWNGDFVTYYIDSARIELHDGILKEAEKALDKEERPVVSKAGLSESEIEALLKKYDEEHPND